MTDIVVVGSLNMDIVISVPRLPNVGETLLALDVKEYAGGKGANQAVAAARLGSKVAMIGKVGSDKNGKILINLLKSEGIDTTCIELSNSPTGTAYVNVSLNGDNNIVVHPGANSDLDIGQINRYENIIKNSKLCILQLEIPYEVVKYVVNLCFESNIPVILNPAPATGELDDDIISKTHILVPNETELLSLLGKDSTNTKEVEQASKELYDKGCKHLIITLGKQGSLYLNDNEVKRFHSKEAKEVDTTAAGDSFIGSLGNQIIENKSIPEAINFATYAAALTVTKVGAQSSLPTKEEVYEFIANYKE